MSTNGSKAEKENTGSKKVIQEIASCLLTSDKKGKCTENNLGRNTKDEYKIIAGVLARDNMKNRKTK